MAMSPGGAHQNRQKRLDDIDGGFVASNCGAVAGSRATMAMRFELALPALGETEARLATLGSTRPES
ncbi:hypothetical protein [Methylocapsa palsarum]|uniref:hypothetical protein n=1 Tax=Methylocapsa palsarum TaxID=1612308 RepID=UPI0011139003|nr:hypothetical protein [Methylocapsa palsarum]